MTAWLNGWGPPAEAEEQVRLHFGAAKSKKALRNFSAGTRVGDTLFLAADEHCDIDQLSRCEEGEWRRHVQLNLGNFLPLADPQDEADLEGLCADDGWLWIVGSHARTRPKAEKAQGEKIDLDLLANLKDTRSRCLLARIPLLERAGMHDLVPRDGVRRAGMLAQGRRGNAIAEALAIDSLLAPFTKIAAKEGGIDIEGIAVAGMRVALGMRGPVIGGHGLLLEVELKADASGELRLAKGPVRRLFSMEGLGVRDLKRLGDDLLILAGPTTALSGPCALYRWRGWVHDQPHDPSMVHLHRPERLLEIPFGRGSDHPEGLALWPLADGDVGIMAIYDSPAIERINVEGRTITADVFRLPG